jgi:hypothetical protein
MPRSKDNNNQTAKYDNMDFFKNTYKNNPIYPIREEEEVDDNVAVNNGDN